MSAWAAIRLDKDSGREWIDPCSIGGLRVVAEHKSKDANRGIPQWVADNPVVRYARIQIQEVQG